MISYQLVWLTIALILTVWLPILVAVRACEARLRHPLKDVVRSIGCFLLSFVSLSLLGLGWFPVIYEDALHDGPWCSRCARAAKYQSEVEYGYKGGVGRPLWLCEGHKNDPPAFIGAGSSIRVWRGQKAYDNSGIRLWLEYLVYSLVGLVIAFFALVIGFAKYVQDRK